MIRVKAGDRILDVGTGTGALARAAAERAGPTGFVVGVDRAEAMLRAADLRDAVRRLVAEAPGLPFIDDAFDLVSASFVLAHCRSYASTLTGMVRVCRPGGRIGISAWGPMPNEPARLWKEIVNQYVDADQLQQAFRAVVPWEEWFQVASHVEQALCDAGLTAVRSARREYTIEVAPTDYVSMKRAGVEGRLIRRMAGELAWDAFTRHIDAEFRQRFPHVVTFVRDVNFGIGTKG
jgi:ubiquinone/menaquinone biosynthesis C-methylase UbiE